MGSRDVKNIVRVMVALAFVLFAPAASAQFYQHPYIEAECPTTASGAYTSNQTSIAGFSGAGYVRSNGNTTAANYNNTSADHASYSVTVRDSTYYVVWFRINTNNSADDDSLYFEFAEEFFPVWVTLNNLPVASGWRWVAVTTAVFPLGPGTYTLKVANRENGLNIDKIAVLPQTHPAPSGAGQPAYNCAVPMYFETECRDGAWNAYQLDKKAKAGYSGSGYIESPTTSTDLNTTGDRATYVFETAAGTNTYNFFFRIHNNQSASNDSWYYRVNGGSWVTMNNTNGLGSGWRWMQGTSGASLGQGKHSLEIRNRESGLSIDKVAFVPSTFTGPSGTGTGSAAVNCESYQTMSDWLYGDVQAYYNTHLNYIVSNGEHMLQHHVDWHGVNGSGALAGAGSGVAFLGFHRAMMNDFRRFALESGTRSWLPISIVGPVIPSTLDDARESLELLSDATGTDLVALWYEPRQNSDVDDFGLPRYLRLGGAADANWASSVTLDGVTYNKLEDYNDLDTLGRAIGSQYHAALHNEIDGTMGTHYSPSDPIFFGWHGLIDRLVTQWLATTKGQAWAAANPSHPFLVQGFIDMHIWNNADWAP